MKRLCHILLAICFLALPALLKAQPAQQQNPQDDPGYQLQKFMQFYRYLNGAYVDTIDNSAVMESGIKEMLAQLDPHSSYISSEEMKAENESMEGSFSGIGVEFNVLRDTIIVVNVIVGGPAEAVGVLPNDRIVVIDGKSAVGVKQTDVPKLLRGPKGSVVEIEVARGGEKEPLDFSIVRNDIPINTVDAAYKVDDGIGYIKVNRFARNTFREFLEAYQKLGDIDGLILDLRGNGGGLLDQAVDLSNFFLPRGSLIVSTEGLRMPPEQIIATRDGSDTKGKVVVLINEMSASGSEIVAGAIQDWDRGLLIGRTTFGKGLVQRQFPLMDGSAVRLTVARYHTPSGRVIQRPYEKGDREKYYASFAERFGKDTFRQDSTQAYKTLRSGRTVYGGGGIAPDIFVENDTASYTDYWGNLVRRGVLNEFVVDYMDQNRGALAARYPDVEAFERSFGIGQPMIDSLVALGNAKGIEPDGEQLARSEKAIKLQLKALIAQKLWGMNEYYYIINSEDDPTFGKALEVLRDWQDYNTGIVP